MHINPASFSVCDARDKLGNVFCPVCRMQRADAVEDWRAGKRGSVQRDEALRAASSGADRSNPRLESVEQRAVSTGAWARHSGPVQKAHGASARAPTQGAAGSYADEARPYKAGHGQQRGNSTGAAADWGVDARLAALLPVPPRGNVAISAAAPSSPPMLSTIPRLSITWSARSSEASAMRSVSERKVSHWPTNPMRARKIVIHWQQGANCPRHGAAGRAKKAYHLLQVTMRAGLGLEAAGFWRQRSSAASAVSV